jgi:hypothetical protein
VMCSIAGENPITTHEILQIFTIGANPSDTLATSVDKARALQGHWYDSCGRRQRESNPSVLGPKSVPGESLDHFWQFV